MASPFDLTTLADVRAWLAITAPNQPGDIILSPLITAASRLVLGFISRSTIISAQYSRRFDGQGWNQNRIMLPDWPVTAISSFSIDNATVPAALAPAANVAQPNGYLLEQWDGSPPGRLQSVDVFGYAFNRGRQNIAITYTAGYLVQNEAQTIPASPGPYTIQANGAAGKFGQFYGAFAADAGVTYANGTALVKVASGPTAGQYSVAADSSGVSTYTFAAADQGAPILVSYSYVPADLAQATKELVGERYSYKDRIGMVSKSLGGAETMSYSQSDIPKPTKLMLQPYKMAVPI